MKIIHGDCLEKLRDMPDNSVDSIVTDPPYGLNFMGKKWDYDVPSVDIWRECLRVLKPGGYLLAFAGTRTQHRMACRIEDAGFEIRDMIAWIYGSGFPKSHDVSKAIDKAAGAEREITGPKSTYREPQSPNGWDCTKRAEFETAPSTDAAKKWAGWGTALKPALEPITLARKPIEGTVAHNVQKWGVGGINVDGCRVEALDHPGVHHAGSSASSSLNWNAGEKRDSSREYYTPSGRFPANLILSEEAGALLDAQSGIQASRFFYSAKASKAERNAGCEGMPEVTAGVGDERPSGQSMQRLDGREARAMANHHPTVKPLALMRYLCRLITPPNGTVLDLFMGSGSTGVAAKQEGFGFIGIEREADYVKIAEARINSLDNILI